jgi:hypothetical protein
MHGAIAESLSNHERNRFIQRFLSHSTRTIKAATIYE